MVIQFSSQIESVKANKDHTLTIKMETQELSADETSKIFEQMGKQIWVAMADVALKANDLDIPESMTEINEKTPSQRLRDRMYVYYKETHKSDTGFRAWYDTALESIGNKYLEKLD